MHNVHIAAILPVINVPYNRIAIDPYVFITFSEESKTMGILFDMFPVLAFFIAYLLAPKGATLIPILTIVAAMAIQIAIQKIKDGAVKKLHLYSFLLLLPFAALAIYFRDYSFVAWKFSIFYWAIGLVILGAYYFKQINLFEKLFVYIEKQLDAVPSDVWARCNIMYAIFMITIGILNIIIFYNFGQDTWFYFKLFGTIGLNMLFLIGVMIYLFKFIPDEEEEQATETTSNDGQ